MNNRKYEIKRAICLICLILTITTNNVFAQSDIVGFLGVNLGESASVSLHQLKKQYSNVEWKFPKITITSVDIAGITFNKGAVLEYKNDKLILGTLTLIERQSTVYGINPFLDDSMAPAEIEAKRAFVRQVVIGHLNNLLTTFSSKYGNPSYSTSTSVVWRDRNSNTIVIDASVNDEIDRHSTNTIGKISITYRLGQSNNF